MPEMNGFNLEETHQRSIVRLRVRPDTADTAAKVMQLPQRALQSEDGNTAIHWLGPDQWLFTSETESATDIMANIDSALSDQLFAATDMSSGLACFSLGGQGSRTLLAMGCGIDMHPASFPGGQCVRTNFAQVPVFIVATGELEFDLYVDRSYAAYLYAWLSAAGKDPMNHPA